MEKYFCTEAGQLFVLSVRLSNLQQRQFKLGTCKCQQKTERHTAWIAKLGSRINKAEPYYCLNPNFLKVFRLHSVHRCLDKPVKY